MRLLTWPVSGLTVRSMTKTNGKVTLTTVLDTIGSKAKVGRMAGCTGQAVSQWQDVIPELSARRLANHTECPFTFEQLPVVPA